jgi:hypothetical protein
MRWRAGVVGVAVQTARATPRSSSRRHSGVTSPSRPASARTRARWPRPGAWTARKRAGRPPAAASAYGTSSWELQPGAGRRTEVPRAGRHGQLSLQDVQRLDVATGRVRRRRAARLPPAGPPRPRAPRCRRAARRAGRNGRAPPRPRRWPPRPAGGPRPPEAAPGRRRRRGRRAARAGSPRSPARRVEVEVAGSLRPGPEAVDDERRDAHERPRRHVTGVPRGPRSRTSSPSRT